MNKPVIDKQHVRALARPTFGNAASLIHLGLVLAAAAFVTVDTLFVAPQDASFAGVWLFLLAAPTVFVFFIGSALWGAEAAGPAWFVHLAPVVSVLLQSLALGWFVRPVHGGSRTRTARPQEA
ncbi:SCO4225 family membrane protein [Streptomyces sp. NPDC088246]|uniref:SCO4225 family membrane protein n=1 Tax=Streptomyces sp. NPDC088246 TaxID=3365842 RepID=UPI0038121EDB